MAERPDQSLERRLDDWLKRGGWPFEVRVGRAFANRGWNVRHGEYYRDPTQGDPREIDLVASVSRQAPRQRLSLDIVIECKQSPDKPWVGFTSPAYSQDPFGFGLVEVKGDDPHWQRQFFEDHLRWRSSRGAPVVTDVGPDPWAFRQPDGDEGSRWVDAWCGVTRVDAGMQSCHGLVQAFRDARGIDAAYVAVRQVESAAQAFAQAASETYADLLDLGVQDPDASIFMPVVVVGGKLFTAALDAHDVLALKQTDHLHARTEHGMVLVLDEQGASRFAEVAYRFAAEALALTRFEGD